MMEVFEKELKVGKQDSQNRDNFCVIFSPLPSIACGPAPCWEELRTTSPFSRVLSRLCKRTQGASSLEDYRNSLDFAWLQQSKCEPSRQGSPFPFLNAALWGSVLGWEVQGRKSATFLPMFEAAKIEKKSLAV